MYRFSIRIIEPLRVKGIAGRGLKYQIATKPKRVVDDRAKGETLPFYSRITPNVLIGCAKPPEE
jgi:hypothetical protein